MTANEPTMSQILQTIEDALSEVLDERVTNLSLATDLQLDLDLDSIRFVQFLLTLEDKVPGLLFNPDTLNQSSFNRVETLVGYIENNRRRGIACVMCSPPFAEKLVTLYRKARSDALGGALMAFGEAVTGVPGFLVCNGFVVHPRAPGIPIVSGDGTANRSGTTG